jgi:hypothetical protein
LQLEFPGVKIQDVSVDAMVTYFEDFDIDLLNALDDTPELEDVEIKARVRRLNHRPFTFSIAVDSDREAMAAVRIMLGPKFDWFGQEIPINEQRLYVIELDRFVAKGEGRCIKCLPLSVSTTTEPTAIRLAFTSTLNVIGRVLLSSEGSATYPALREAQN